MQFCYRHVLGMRRFVVEAARAIATAEAGDDQPVVRICGVAAIAGQAELRQLEIVAVTDADLPLDDHHQLHILG
jgi:hypothetical protein